MIINSLSIMSCRGIRQLENLELNSLMAIVGKNDTGKSTILHAINTFYNDIKLEEEDRFLGPR